MKKTGCEATRAQWSSVFLSDLAFHWVLFLRYWWPCIFLASILRTALRHLKTPFFYCNRNSICYMGVSKEIRDLWSHLAYKKKRTLRVAFETEMIATISCLWHLSEISLERCAKLTSDFRKVDRYFVHRHAKFVLSQRIFLRSASWNVHKYQSHTWHGSLNHESVLNYPSLAIKLKLTSL